MAFDLPFSPKAPPLIGLDIGSSSVKIVELSEAGKGTLRLERYAIEPLPRGSVVDGNVDKIDVVAEAVRRAWRRAGGKVKNVAMALPASAVITKRIALPANLREEELEMQVESEANQYIPFALDEVSLDFQVLGAIPNAPDDVEVLIAASRKEKVEDRVAVAQAAGLKPMVVDVESYSARSAIERLIEQLPNSGEGLVIAVFYIGANTTSVTVMHDGEAIYEREQPFGGQQLTGDISRTYGIPTEEAEQKKRSGDLPADYETAVLKPFIDTATIEITQQRVQRCNGPARLRGIGVLADAVPHIQAHGTIVRQQQSCLPNFVGRHPSNTLGAFRSKGRRDLAEALEDGLA